MYTYMKQTYRTISKFVAVFALVATILIAPHAFAMQPTLSLTNQGGSSVQLSVYGDANASVTLEYQTTYGLQTAGIIGYTNTSGYFTGILTSSAYSFTGATQVLVLVDNQQSNLVYWPYTSGYNNGYTNGTLSLSQTSINLASGQTSSITAYSVSGPLYLSTNTNPSVATATLYGDTVNITGIGYGSTTLTVCSSENGCTNVYITVSSSGIYNNGNYTNYGYGTTLSFSQNNVSVSTGQSTTLYVYGGSGNNYYVSGTNGIVSASVNGNLLNIEGLSTGSTSLQVCSTYGTSCGTLYVTVSGYNNYNNYNNNYNYTTYPYNTYNGGTLSLSTNNVTLSAGQTQTVQIYNGTTYNTSYSYLTNNAYYISSYSNPGIISPSISGNNLIINAMGSGTATITVCSNNGGACATVTVTVSSPYGYNYGNNQYGYPYGNNNQYPCHY